MLRTFSLRRTCTSSTTTSSRRNLSQAPWADAIASKNASVNALVFTADCPATTSGPLHDVPVAVKDNICTKDMKTTCSSEMLREFASPFDATVVRLLQQAGAPIVGKANCDEFGMGSLNTYSVHGPVVNPYQPPSSDVPWREREQRSAGGSSGGSAAAVAAGMCRAALGTDTGGSTRLPASYCGVVGLKPSYGIVSRWGVISYADSLDCVGVLGASVEDTQRVFDVISVYDEKDPSAAPPETRRNAASEAARHGEPQYTSTDLSTLRIGIPQEYFPSELSQTIIDPLRKLIEALKHRGATVIPVSLPSTQFALSAYYVIASAEASSNLARYDGIQYGLRVDPPQGANTTKTANVYAHTRSKGFGAEVQRRILLGTYALTADAFDNYFLQAQRVRKAVRADFDRVFRARNVLNAAARDVPDGVDVLLHPSAIQTAPLLADPNANSAEKSLNAYVQDVLTVPASLAGLPALSLPVGLAADSWPVGASVVGQWGCDEMVLRVGAALEQVISDENTVRR